MFLSGITDKNTNQLHLISPHQVTVDGANGVGAMKSRELSKHVTELLNITTVFDGSDGVLNHLVCT